MDISLTDMLRSSTPVNRDRASPKTSPYQQSSGSIILHKRRTCAIQINHSEKLQSQIDEKFTVLAAEISQLRESQQKIEKRVDTLEELCLENSKFDAKNAKRTTSVEKLPKASKARCTPAVPRKNKYAVLEDLPNDGARMEDRPLASSRSPRQVHKRHVWPSSAVQW